MALPLQALKMLAPYLRGANVLSLGYPDILVPADHIQALFGYTPEKFADDAARKWHQQKFPLPQTEELFERLESTLTVVDFTADRGMEKIADLNEPHDLGKFDLVIDPGTLEHCFNIGQAFLNAANAVKVGGRIFHLSPLNMMNHGFFNLNPTLFHDFYEQNGWEAEISLVPQPVGSMDPTARFAVNAEYLVRCLAQRRTEAAIIFPIQSKYLNKLAARKAA